MYRLIEAMKVPGFSWPTCPNASSSAARKEVYEACPEGWTVGYSDVGHEGNRSVPNKCEKREESCASTIARQQADLQPDRQPRRRRQL